MSSEAKKNKLPELRFMETSIEQESGEVGDVSKNVQQEDSITNFLRYMMLQNDRRMECEKEDRDRRERQEERDRQDREDRLQREREWMLKMEEREEEKRKAEFVREERRAQREEQMRKDREDAEVARRRDDEKHRVAAGLREREATLEQQQVMRLANSEMHDMHAQQQVYAALLGRLPKFDGQQMPVAFIQSLEKQLRDHAIPERKWLGALESCFLGDSLKAYWTLVDEKDRQDYAHAKQAVLKCLGPACARKLDQVGVCKWPKDESLTDVCEECVQHVKSFLVGGETAEEVAYKWMFTRLLAKCKRECADAVWKTQPKSIPEAIAAILEWEHKYGSPAKVWVRKQDGFYDKKVDGQPGMFVKKEPGPGIAEGGAKVKVEKDWSGNKYGQGERNSFKCYKCGESAHIRKNSTKTQVKRVEVLSDEDEGESLLLEGVVNGHVVMFEMDTGAETCMIPERLAGGLQKTGMTACKPVGTSFAADSVIVRVKVGCIDREVTAVVTPDSFISNPLIGRNVGIDDLLVCAGMARALQKTGTQVEAHAVKTRAQSKKEVKAEQQAEVTRSAENPVIWKPEEVEQVVVQTVIRAETRPEVTSPNPGEAAGEPEAVVDVTPTLDENGEPLAVVNESIDADVNVGLVIPSMEFGASLGDEYKGAMENDETLKDWKCWGSARKNGFLWDSGVLKRNVEDEMSGSRELFRLG